MMTLIFAAAAVVSLLWFAFTGREEALKRLIGFVSAVLATAFVTLMLTGPIGAGEHVRIGVMVLALGVFVTPVVPWRWRFGWLTPPLMGLGAAALSYVPLPSGGWGFLFVLALAVAAWGGQQVYQRWRSAK
jgi:hypothetical protein